MGQSSSSAYSADAIVESVTPREPASVTIGYVHVSDPHSLELKKVVLGTDAFARVGELKDLAHKLKTEAVHHDINVTVELGTAFRPTGITKSPAMKHILSNVFAGIYILNLDINGDFAADVDYWARIEWWKDVQHFVTNMGFRFRKSSEITCPAIMPDKTFSIKNQWPREDSMTHLALNVDGFVFEE